MTLFADKLCMYLDGEKNSSWSLLIMKNENDNRIEIYQREEAFHDSEYFERERISFFYTHGATSVAIDHAFKLMGDLREKTVLEIGCGLGSNILRIARSGAYVTGIDIASMRVEKTISIIERENIQIYACAMKMNAENLEFSDGFFDVVFGSGILHHLNIDIVLPEIRRVLKRDGKAVFIEPLGENPLINYYRKQTPNLRTEDEHPLIERDFKLFHKHFLHVQRKNFFFFSLVSYVFRTLVRNEKMFKLSNRILSEFDRVLIAVLPFLGKYCWQTVIKLENN